MVKLVREQGKTQPKEVYFDNKLPTAIGGVLILGGAIIATLVRTTSVREPDV